MCLMNKWSCFNAHTLQPKPAQWKYLQRKQNYLNYHIVCTILLILKCISMFENVFIISNARFGLPRAAFDELLFINFVFDSHQFSSSWKNLKNIENSTSFALCYKCKSLNNVSLFSHLITSFKRYTTLFPQSHQYLLKQ